MKYSLALHDELLGALRKARKHVHRLACSLAMNRAERSGAVSKHGMLIMTNILDNVGDGNQVVLDYAVWIEGRQRQIAVDKVVEFALLGLFARAQMCQHFARQILAEYTDQKVSASQHQKDKRCHKHKSDASVMTKTTRTKKSPKTLNQSFLLAKHIKKN